MRPPGGCGGGKGSHSVPPRTAPRSARCCPCPRTRARASPSPGALPAQTVGSAGGTLSTKTATLTIPAGTFAQSTQVTLRETEPQHPGRSNRIEVEPHGLALAQPARLSVRVDDSNAKVKMHDGNDDLDQVEVADRNRGATKTATATTAE